MVDVELRLDTDDPDLLRECETVIGGPLPSPSPPRARLIAALTSRVPDRPGFARLDISGDDLADPVQFLLALSSPTVPIQRLPAPDSDDAALGIGEDPEPALLFRGRQCFVRTRGRWRRILTHVLLLRALRLRGDALFFHAASLVLDGTGVLLVGPKGSGKTTLALAVAARGHGFLGDETACYLPGTGELLPFRRPVAIKPGPRTARVPDALARDGGGDEDGLWRGRIESLFPAPVPAPAPLGAVIFLRGFAERADLARVEPGREEVAWLQPVVTCLVNRPATHRVFEMIRLLGRVRAYRLLAGPPDDTAARVESALRDDAR